MKTTEEILKEQIVALNELVRIKDQIITELKSSKYPVWTHPSYPIYPWYHYYTITSGTSTSGSLVGQPISTVTVDNYASTNSNFSPLSITEIHLNPNSTVK